jgi:hypothetical protein
MKEFNKLLSFREYYEYDLECEVIRIADGEFRDQAKELYSHIVRDFFLKDDDKWAFDIALDCVHNFTDEECKIINRQGEIGDYHFGYGMYVRNHYVHPSKLHSYFMADNVSGRVAAFIYTIMFPVYNCLSEEFMKLDGDYDFDYIRKQFGETQPIINEMYEKLADWNCKITAKEAVKIIIQTIQANLGRDGFKNILLPIIREHVEKHGHINREWNDLVNKVYSKTRLYNKEYHQFQTLQHIGILSKIASPFASITTVEEGRDYLIENLGLVEEDALRLAECAFEIEKIHQEVRNQKK